MLQVAILMSMISMNTATFLLSTIHILYAKPVMPKPSKDLTIIGRGLKTKSWNIKTLLAELGVFMHKFAIETDPKP